MEKINILENENRILTDSNKSAEIDLKNMKALLKTVQADANNWNEKYKKLQLKNKDLLAKIIKIKDKIVNNNVAYFKHLLKTKNIHVIEKNYCGDSSINSGFKNEGSL